MKYQYSCYYYPHPTSHIPHPHPKPSYTSSSGCSTASAAISASVGIFVIRRYKTSCCTNFRITPRGFLLPNRRLSSFRLRRRPKGPLRPRRSRRLARESTAPPVTNATREPLLAGWLGSLYRDAKAGADGATLRELDCGFCPAYVAFVSLVLSYPAKMAPFVFIFVICDAGTYKGHLCSSVKIIRHEISTSFEPVLLLTLWHCVQSWKDQRGCRGQLDVTLRYTVRCLHLR